MKPISLLSVPSFRRLFCGAAVLGLLTAAACSTEPDDGEKEDSDLDGGGGSGEGGAGGDGNPGLTAPRYALSSMLWDDQGNTTTYVNLLADLGVEEVNNDQAHEFAGAGDVWRHGDSLFVSSSVDLTITKYKVVAGKLVAGDSIGLSDYGITDFGFWRSVFVAPDKAYILNGTSEFIIWNPSEMIIEGSFDVPELPDKDGLAAYTSYADRAAYVRDGRVYWPIYYTNPDESFFVMAAQTSLLVIDVAQDEVADVVDLPCPGIDFVSHDDDDNLYFSSWVFAPGGAAVIDQPATCVVKLAAGSEEPQKLFDVADVAGGREGGMFRYLGDGKAFVSILHDERDDSEDPSDVADGANWKFWLYDLASGTATPSDALPFNAGAAYDVWPDGKPHILVPAGDYASTQLFELHSDGTADAKFTSLGWSLRLFDLP